MKDNKISQINARLLQFPLLKKIYLRYNQLKQLEDMGFSTWGIRTYGIVSIVVAKNPWHCNESMEVLIETLCVRQGFTYFRGNPIRMRLELSGMVCESPADVKGEAFSSVFQGVIQELDNCPGGELPDAIPLTDLSFIAITVGSTTMWHRYKYVDHRPHRLFIVVLGPTTGWHE